MAKIPERAEFGLLKMKFLEMLGISVLVLALGISFIIAVCFSLGALANG
ncbi:hypothetical protein HPHPP11B_0304 [Helicobacter pylori Hp P-11b]|uniref:Uncharacterized protein n=1 Tax=Helicobacter pylori Hp P-11b TaxID=992106 RepID=J0S663_HELPX|nr:hypothetical protein HPHPP11_0249 [Helicobacter pylori Hp P-11]EJC31001.1 hypothetical protein HPHPP11B_0304 [Helicobacter pylori Hp P-11b]